MGQPITLPHQPWRANQRGPALQSLIHSPVEAPRACSFCTVDPEAVRESMLGLAS